MWGQGLGSMITYEELHFWCPSPLVELLTFCKRGTIPSILVWRQDLDLMILMGPSQPRMLHGSGIPSIHFHTSQHFLATSLWSLPYTVSFQQSGLAPCFHQRSCLRMLEVLSALCRVVQELFIHKEDSLPQAGLLSVHIFGIL